MRRGRLISASITMAVLSLLVAYVTPAARAAKPHAGDVTVSIWTAFNGAQLAAFNYLAGNFMRLYPYIKIQEVSAPNYTALFQKEQSAVFAGNTPTIAQAYEQYTAAFNKSHAVQNLEPYIKGKHGLSAKDIKDFFPGMWADGLLGKQRLMMPFSKSDEVMYYDGPKLRRFGIKSPPKTWAQFAADCKKVTVLDKGRPVQWCSTVGNDASIWFTLEHDWGNQVINKKGKAAFATRQGAAPVQFIANMIKHKELVLFTSANYQDQADYDAGKTMFDFSSSAGITYVVGGAKPGVGVAEAPLPGGPMHTYTEMYGAPLIMFKKASTAEKNAGWLFLKYITEPRQTAYWSIHTGYMPVRKSALRLPEMKAFYKQHPQDHAAVEQLNHVIFEPTNPGWAKARDDIATELTAAYSGNKSAMAAMQKAAKEVDADMAGK